MYNTSSGLANLTSKKMALGRWDIKKIILTDVLAKHHPTKILSNQI